MLTEIINRIISECDNCLARLEEEELNLKNCVDYLDIYKMRDEFKRNLVQLTKTQVKEKAGEEKENDKHNDEEQGKQCSSENSSDTQT